MEWVNIKDRWYELAPRPAPVPKSALAAAAHLFAFYYGVVSGITPPVARDLDGVRP